MHLRLIINWLLVLFFVNANTVSVCQEEPDFKVDSPYRSEYNPWFKFGTFKRGFKNEIIKESLDSLENKSRNSWSRYDSLKFAQLSMKTGNLELAAYYFSNIKVDFHREEVFWWDRLVLHFIQREYNSCLSMIRNREPGLVEFSKLWFFKKLCDAKLRSLKDEKWFKHESVLSWEIDSSVMILDKDGPEFREKVIDPLENLSFVLEKVIRYIHDEDEVLARTCFEMGVVLDAYVSPTQAYIAMSLGRNYDKWDKEILHGIKEVKSHIVEKKYRIPVFRKHFPRIEYWRFDYNMLKEKIIYERNDTLIRKPPVLIKEVEDKSLNFNTSLVILSGVAIMFFLLLFFLRTNTKPGKK